MSSAIEGRREHQQRLVAAKAGAFPREEVAESLRRCYWFFGGLADALFMDQTTVGNEAQKTEVGLPVTPDQIATLALEAVEGHSIISSPTPEPPEAPAVNPHLLSDADIQMFQQGTHCRLQEKLGAHPVTVKGVSGVQFAVWAPNAERVSVMGDFNHWDRKSHPLRARGDCGIWEGFVPGARPGLGYKYFIESRYHGYRAEKADPFAFHAELPPKSASMIWDLNYAWGDGVWMKERARRNALEAPISIYEVHAGSWMRVPEEGCRWLTYRELAVKLAAYCREMGFTHVEFLPLTEHPLYRSWGYQTTGYFAPTSRYGSPQDFMFLVDYLHQQGIGVFMDWVPSHFPTDGHGLARFDGTYLYEHADPRKGFHPEWTSAIFNYGRHEVSSFLLSSALFWLEQYHVDGLRVDGVASMLYLDYARKPGEWIPNQYGGHENLEAMDFLRRLNETIYREQPEVQTIAEESTAWSQVSRPTYTGGLGFGLKWDMGWMHDTLRYLKRNAAFRKYHHGELSFRMVYAFHENFVLPLSHDETVHGKGSLFGMMAGDEWQKYANLRLLFGYMYGLPGKKLLFMGDELAQWPEWNHESSIEWHVTQEPHHAGVQLWVKDLNHLYQSQPALHERDFSPDGFQWIDHSDADNSTLFFLRRGRKRDDLLLAAFNFRPVLRPSYRVGVPRGGYWKELLNSDAQVYGGSGQGNCGGVEAGPVKWHHQPYSLRLTLPPLSASFFLSQGGTASP
jgi:1,4-alpha-glucan branching enzyme